MQEKPIISIDKFVGSGSGGMFYNEGFSIDKENGKSIIYENYSTINSANASTTGFSSIGIVYSGIFLTTVNDFSYKYKLFIDTSKNIFCSARTATSIKSGIIHQMSDDASLKPDLIELPSGNILYTGKRYVGKGVRTSATGGSTTTIIDTTKNWSTSGINNGDKVTNLKTGIEYTITSISTTTNTNDTLNFTASGSNTNSAGDEIIAWDDNFIDTQITKKNWQPSSENWTKQLRQYGDVVYITNGNYLAKLASDETTFEEDYKKLPAKFQALCFDTNTDRILVGASFNGVGRILLWDGYSDGWNNILEFDRPINAISNYNSGWVFVSAGILYYTDGNQIVVLSDTRFQPKSYAYNLQPSGFNGILSYGNNIYFTNISEDYNKVHPGVFVFDGKSGWSIVKPKKSTRQNGTPYCLVAGEDFENISTIYIAGDGFIDILNTDSSEAEYNCKSFIYYISLKRNIQVKAIGINLSNNFKKYDDQTSSLSSDIIVNVGDGNSGILSFSQTAAAGITESSISVDGTTYLNNSIGDEVNVLSGTLVGERSFITSIANKGTANEVWTVSPSFSGKDENSSRKLQMIRVKSFGEKTVSFNDMKDEKMFFSNSGIESDKIFIEIVVRGKDNSFPITISNINVYGN